MALVSGLFHLIFFFRLKFIVRVPKVKEAESFQYTQEI